MRDERLKVATMRRVYGLSKPCVFWCAGAWHVQRHPMLHPARSDDRRAFNDLMEDRNGAAYRWARRR